MWTGLFALKYQKFIADLKPYFSAAERAKLNGIRYMAPDFNPAKGFLVMPLEVQFYIGFYNKALFKKAGLSGPPESWAELQTACQAERQGDNTDPRRRGLAGDLGDVPALVRLQLPDGRHPLAGSVAWPLHGEGCLELASRHGRCDEVGGTADVGVHEQGRADQTRRPRPVREGQGCHDLRRELGHRHAPEGPREQARRFRPAVPEPEDPRRDPVPGRWLLAHELLEAQGRGRAVPEVHADAGCSQDRLGRGPDSGRQGIQDDESRPQRDARSVREAGLRQVPDARQRNPAGDRDGRPEAARRRVRRHDLRPEGAGRHDVDPRRHSRRSQRTRCSGSHPWSRA